MSRINYIYLEADKPSGWRSYCSCGWMSNLEKSERKAEDAHADHEVYMASVVGD
jgi:hypothetical protein